MPVTKVFKLLLLSVLFITTVAFIDLTNLVNYSAQTVPAYIQKNNTPLNNNITDAGATLGRVLFYDKNLSANNTIACASCHQQQFAFSDTARRSIGLNGGLTGRHSMRLAYARFSTETKFFWDERASTLEGQTTRPIQDAVEMGFSGTNGQLGIDSLIRKMRSIDYYPVLFKAAFGDTAITEQRMQFALGQFVRSMYTFDSKFDAGLAQAPNINAPFSNFTQQENTGKTLFINPPPAGGAGCQGCHRAPEFDIDPATLNNGVIADAANPTILDLNNTKAPSLRDLFNPQGVLNGLLMHNGNFATIDAVLAHYNQVPQNPGNTNLDPRLQGPGGNLQLNQQQLNAIAAFLRTLSSQTLYTDARWSNPFDANGQLQLITDIQNAETTAPIKTYPNPVHNELHIDLPQQTSYTLKLYTLNGQLVATTVVNQSATINLHHYPKGILILQLLDNNNKAVYTQRLVKE